MKQNLLTMSPPLIHDLFRGTRSASEARCTDALIGLPLCKWRDQSAVIMLKSVAFWIVVEAALVVFLCVSVALRHRAEAVARRAQTLQVSVNAFDCSLITPRLRHVRDAVIPAVRARQRPTPRHHALLASTRCIVANLGYFRRARLQSRSLAERN